MARFISLFFLMMVTSGFSQNDKLTLPSVKIEPAINEYYEGDRVELQCTASGHPTPGTTWQRTDSHPLPPAVEVYEGLFIIPSAKQEDSGEYICIAWNAVGVTARTVAFAVRPPRRRLTVTPDTSTLSEGQSTRLVCTGTTNVTASTINWIRQDGTEFMTNVRSDNGVLYIDIARPENQGVYICRATSPESEVTPVPVLVTVLPLGPPPPSEPPNVTVSVGRMKIPTGGGGTVDCNPTGYPLRIKWKKHQGAFGPGVSQRDNTLVINNATDDDQGFYKCEGITGSTPIAVTYVFVEIENKPAPKNDGATGTVNMSSSVNTTLAKRGESPVYMCTLDKNQQPYDRRRVSERKCEEYSKSLVRTVYAIGLLPGLPTMYVKTAVCNKTVESLPLGFTTFEPGEFPHLVAVGRKDEHGAYSFISGGTLISPRFVLSRSFSVAYDLPNVVQLMSKYFAVSGGRSEVLPIKTTYKHPHHKSNGMVLLELQNDVDITADIRPACLWTKPDFDGRNKANLVGKYDSRESSHDLQKVTLPLLENERCPLLGHRATQPELMCTGAIDSNERVLLDDAGFPLEVTADDNPCIHYVMGVSYGDWAHNIPSVYHRVSSYLDWIEGIVWPGE